jgi:hypothetical protein
VPAPRQRRAHLSAEAKALESSVPGPAGLRFAPAAGRNACCMDSWRPVKGGVRLDPGRDERRRSPVRVSALQQGSRLRPWKPSVRDIPHLTIETNLTCNASCRSCYVVDRITVKTLGQIVAEIDAGLRARRADTVTLLGGEPTLHPNLCDVVRDVSRRGVTCQLLTNGLRFLAPEGEALLDALKAAGLFRILLHVDPGQPHVNGRPLDMIHRLFPLFEARRFFFSLSWTAYPGGDATLSMLPRDLAVYPHFDGILVLVEAPGGQNLEKGDRPPGRRMEEIYGVFSSSLAVEPSLYLPSSLDDSDVTWLTFFYYLNVTTGRTLAVSPALVRAYQRLHRAIVGREAFGQTPSRSRFALALAATMLLEMALDPGRAAVIADLIRGSHFGRDLRFHYIAVQDPPLYDPEKGAVRICYHCPDATIRRGRLIPVCLADRMAPLSDGVTPPAHTQDLCLAVQRHLEQAPWQ